MTALVPTSGPVDGGEANHRCTVVPDDGREPSHPRKSPMIWRTGPSLNCRCLFAMPHSGSRRTTTDESTTVTLRRNPWTVVGPPPWFMLTSPSPPSCPRKRVPGTQEACQSNVDDLTTSPAHRTNPARDRFRAVHPVPDHLRDTASVQQRSGTRTAAPITGQITRRITGAITGPVRRPADSCPGVFGISTGENVYHGSGTPGPGQENLTARCPIRPATVPHHRTWKGLAHDQQRPR